MNKRECESIYGLFDPAKPEEFRYIGRTTYRDITGRLAQHLNKVSNTRLSRLYSSRFLDR